jgi:2-polyprenyl-3-methyl-5-hydroxy-6-metoxy-1,4-benzoquinol methylase
MNQEEKWDNLYFNNKNAFGLGLRKSLYHDFIVDHIKPQGKLLDLGVGQGALAIPLGKVGYSKIVGVDISKLGLDLFKENARKENVNVEAVHSNFLDFKFKEKYDLIISCVSIQFLENKDDISKVISRMKQHTKIGGYNMVSVPTLIKVAIEFPYMFKDKSELYNYYRDWKLIIIEEDEGRYSNGKNGTTARIIAKRVN